MVEASVSRPRGLSAVFCAVLCVVLSAPLVAQGAPSSAGCGLPDVSFNVKTKAQHPVGQPEPGKALIYFFQDDSLFGDIPRPTSRYAIDGSWVGATHSDSYYFLSIAPGEHHLCTEWQDADNHQAAALHFTAQAGNSYYFRVENISSRLQWSSRLEPIDSDEGQLLIRRFSLSISHPKQ
jgi:hypothetical protein